VNEWYVTGGSAVVVLLMIGVAAALGFRRSTRLDEAQLARLAAAEGAEVVASIIAPDGRSALVQLAGGKLLIARSMGADVSARVAAPGAAQVRLNDGRLSVTFGDLGYPPLHMRLEDRPAWLAKLCEERTP
jgi:hypothetical protein